MKELLIGITTLSLLVNTLVAVPVSSASTKRQQAQTTNDDKADGVAVGVHDYQNPTATQPPVDKAPRSTQAYTPPVALKDGIQMAVLPANQGSMAAVTDLNQNTLQYGYFWWLEQVKVADKEILVNSARGAMGQFVFYVADLDLVAVFTSTNQGPAANAPVKIMSDVLIPAFISPGKNTGR